MNDRKEKLLKELEHLDKAHRAGIIDNREYSKGRDRIESKLAEIESVVKQKEESSKVVTDILESEKEPAVEIVDMPEDNYGVIIEEMPKKTDAPVEYNETEQDEIVGQIPGKPAKETEEFTDDSPATEAVEDKESTPESDEMEDEKKDERLTQASKPKPRKIFIKKRKVSKKIHEDAEFENEDAVTFSWRPLLAVIALIIVFAGVYMLFKYTSGETVAPPVEPISNVIKSSELSLEVKDVTIPIEVYSDFRCGPCRMTREHIKDLQKTYGGSLEIIYKNFPLDQNLNAAIAAECARNQSMYDVYADKLYQAPSSDESTLKRYAKELGLNHDLFSSCFDGQVTRPKIISDYKEGLSRGVKGTPTIFINDRMMEGYRPYAELKEMVDFQLS